MHCYVVLSNMCDSSYFRWGSVDSVNMCLCLVLFNAVLYYIMVICRTDVIGLWNAVSVFYVKCEVDSCSAKRQFDYWPPDNSVVVPWLSSWPRTKIGVQNLLECLPLVSVYLRPSFIVTGIAHVFIQWMADSPAADSALKFINVLTGAASERYICKLHACKAFMAIQLYHGMNVFLHMISVNRWHL